jgi:hypothetical protein
LEYENAFGAHALYKNETLLPWHCTAMMICIWEKYETTAAAAAFAASLMLHKAVSYLLHARHYEF